LRALLVDDQRLLLDALQLLLETRHADIVLDVAPDEAQALALAVRNDYDLILLDWWLGREPAESCFMRLRELEPAARIVVMSGDDSPELIRHTLELGAAGFLPKRLVGGRELVDALGVIMGGGIFLPGHTFSQTSESSGRPAWMAREIGECFPGLTTRQRDVLKVLLRGQSDKHIARQLDIAVSTVKTHLQALYRTLEVASRAEAVALAARMGVRVD
jgi:DNA-binding NarL/FixJ family response regulator